jgi:hypothetical protein
MQYKNNFPWSIFLWRTPQQMLRTHRSLKACCATLWWRWLVLFSFFLVMEPRWNEIDRENRSTGGKTCPSVTLSTTNPTWNDPGSNSGLRCERPATNRLRHGTAFPWSIKNTSKIIKRPKKKGFRILPTTINSSLRHNSRAPSWETFMSASVSQRLVYGGNPEIIFRILSNPYL